MAAARRKYEVRARSSAESTSLTSRGSLVQPQSCPPPQPTSEKPTIGVTVPTWSSIV